MHPAFSRLPRPPRAAALTGALLVGAGSLLASERPAGAQESASLPESVRTVTLEEAVEIALRRSPGVEQARANLRSQRARENGALGSFLPTVDLGYGFSQASTGRLDPTGQSITRTSFTSQLTGSLTLFDGMRRLHDLRSSRRSVAAQRATYERQRYETRLRVKTAFYNALAARRRVGVERARVHRLRRQLDFVRQQIDLGQAIRSDSLRTRVDLNSAEVALLNARQSVRSARYALGEAAGVPEPLAPAESATLQPDTLQWKLEELVRIAQERAPSVRSARLEMRAADADLSSARSAYWPSFRLSGGFDWQNERFPPSNGSWSVQVTGSVPLFDGLQRETSVDRAQAQLDLSRATVRAAELAVRTDVNDAYSQMETALAQLELARESVELAREDLRVTRQRYRLGVATIVDLQSAQVALRQAQLDVIRRRYDYQVAVARLESLMGADLERVAAQANRSDATSPNPTDEDRQ